MIEPKNSLVKQYQKIFELEGVKLEFLDEALKEISKIAFKRKTGARALRSIFENFMIDAMYKLPSQKKQANKTIVVTPEVVCGEIPLIPDQARKTA